VLLTQKIAEIKIFRGLAPDGAAYDAPSDPVVGCGRDTPPHFSAPLDVFGVSVVPRPVFHSAEVATLARLFLLPSKVMHIYTAYLSTVCMYH